MFLVVTPLQSGSGSEDDSGDDEGEDASDKKASKKRKKSGKEEESDEEYGGPHEEGDAEICEGLSGDEVDRTNIITGGRGARRTRARFGPTATGSAKINYAEAEKNKKTRPGFESDDSW